MAQRVDNCRMSKILELLNSDHFRQRTEMYVGSRRFDAVSLWLAGLSAALRILELPSPLADEFDPWLRRRFNEHRSTKDWTTVFKELYGDGEAATDQFFVLWHEFRSGTNE